jgi:hypothetical protein
MAAAERNLAAAARAGLERDQLRHRQERGSDEGWIGFDHSQDHDFQGSAEPPVPPLPLQQVKVWDLSEWEESICPRHKVPMYTMPLRARRVLWTTPSGRRDSATCLSSSGQRVLANTFMLPGCLGQIEGARPSILGDGAESA